MSNATGERNLDIIREEVLEVFPEKTRKERRKHMMVTDPEQESVGKCIISNRKSQPGVMTVRGCSYAGSKGVVFGPIKDMAHISHGPIGCGQYSRAGRRNYYTGVSGVDSFGTLNFTSDFQERDIVFGGDKKLTKLIEEMEMLFPLTKGISIQSECPVGLIGDDIEAVANASRKALNKPVIPVRCEGFRGVSQSLGHHIANDVIRDWVLDNREGKPFESTPYDVAIIGDYNIGGDAPGVAYFARRDGVAGGGAVVRRRHAGGDGKHPVREAQPRALLPLHELHLPSYGGKTRHSVDGVQLLWPDQNRRVAAENRRSV